MEKTFTRHFYLKFLFATFFYLLIPWLAFAQQIIKGTVLDQNDKPIPGVSILEKGTKNGTSTNGEGKFILTIQNSKAILIARIVGFLTVEKPVTTNATLNFSLQDDNKVLDEVVLIGYQKITRKKSTASISSISGKELANLPAASFDQLLQGRLSGVNVQNFTGQPGVSPTVSVRGNSTASTSYDQFNTVRTPLYVVDGVPQSSDDFVPPGTGTGTNYLAGINPNDIESIDVLKDASAAAIYGSRAANGVILITTKKGVSGETKVALSSYVGFVQRPDLREATIGATERRQKMEVLQRQLTYDQRRQLPYLLTDSLNPAFNGNTDWQDLFYQVGKINDNNLSITGGSDNGMTYRFSGGYYNEQGIIKGTGFKRYSSRINLTSRALNKKLMINPQFYYSSADRARGNEDPDDPNKPTKIGSGNLPSSLINLSPEKLDFFVSPNSENLDKNISNQFGINLNLSYEFNKHFTLNSQSSYTSDNTRRDASRSSLLNNNFGNSATSFSSSGIGLRTSNYLNYNGMLGKHSFSAVVGQDIEYNKYQNTQAAGYGGASDNIQVVTGFQQANIFALSQYRAHGLIAYYGRFNYDYDSKYLLSGTLRTDGSSGFGENNKYGVFPSVSVGWILSEENFMKNITNNPFTLVKIRGSYGATGNEDLRNSYVQYNKYLVNNGGFEGNGAINGVQYGLPGATSYNGVTAITPNFVNGVAQKDLSWEKSTQWNIGTDIEFQNGKYALSFDVYNKEVKDKLFNVDLPVTSGYDNAFTNAFSVRNSGMELTFNATPISKKIKWNTSFNISYNKNQIMSLPNGGRDIVLRGDRFDKSHILSVGSPINAFYLYRTNGVFSRTSDIPVNPFTGELYKNTSGTYAAGDFYLADLDGDGIIDVFNDGINPDKMPVGDPNPRFTGGWTNNFSYKNFSLSIFATFTFKRDVLNLFDSDRFANSQSLDAVANFANFSTPDLDRLNIWRNPGDNAEYAKYDLGSYRYYYTGAQTFFLEKGGYLRIKSINIGYDLNARTLKRLGLSQFKIFAIVDNVHMFQQSKKLPDAEAVNGYGEYNGNGYPIPRKYTLGLQVQF
ncbi:SusC/RagA family TonB-linked outer membrane protein [Agrobacterium tumefaciens]|nr:SusC/RagA family TonB-linked outer membrane protein [Agrobacterium tumefaciens]NTE18367.1 SusC/RagA family TonB-linked outer membrane protein [Agrobacterium tumefaciens]